MTDDKTDSLRGLELYVWDKLTEDRIIRTGDIYDMEKFRGLVRSAYYSTLPPPCPEEVAHLVADKLRTIRK